MQLQWLLNIVYSYNHCIYCYSLMLMDEKLFQLYYILHSLKSIFIIYSTLILIISNLAYCKWYFPTLTNSSILNNILCIWSIHYWSTTNIYEELKTINNIVLLSIRISYYSSPKDLSSCRNEELALWESFPLEALSLSPSVSSTHHIPYICIKIHNSTSLFLGSDISII